MRIRREPTLYDLLDCSPHATMAELNAAYRHTAKAIHPDAAGLSLSPDEWEQRLTWTKTLNSAWEVLRSPERRAEYDASIGLRPPSAIALRLSKLSGHLVRPRQSADRFSKLTRGIKPSHLRPGLGLPTFATPRILDAAWELVYATRLGQWGLLIVSSVFIHALIGLMIGDRDIPTQLRGVIELGLVALVAAFLSRAGEPTPVVDARKIIARLDERAYVVLRHALVSVSAAAGHAMAQGAEQAVARGRAAAAAAAEDGTDELDNLDEIAWADELGDAKLGRGQRAQVKKRGRR